MGYLSLSLDTANVTFRGFIEFKPLRVRAQKPDIERSAAGNAILYGTTHELPHIWEFQGVLSKADWQTLEAMFFEYERCRRNFLDCKILLIDTFQEFVEKAPRTRAVAPAPLNAVTPIGTSSVSYYAQYYALFAKAPEMIQMGRLRGADHEGIAVQMILEEDSLKVAP